VQDIAELLKIGEALYTFSRRSFHMKGTIVVSVSPLQRRRFDKFPFA
jgi:hypothetical protein